MTDRPLHLADLRGCEDDMCPRHRALSPWLQLQALRTVAACVSTVGLLQAPLLLMMWLTAPPSLPPPHYAPSNNYMVAYVVDAPPEVGPGELDTIVHQIPQDFDRHAPRVTWTLLVKRSGAVEVKGNRDNLRKEFWGVQARPCFMRADTHAFLAWSISGGTLTFRKDGSDVEAPWTVQINGDRTVTVYGDIPTDARAFWQDLAKTARCRSLSHEPDPITIPGLQEATLR